MRVADPLSLTLSAVQGLVLGGGVGFVAAQALGAYGCAVGVAVAALVAVVHGRGPLRRWRTARRALPEGDRRWLARHIPYYGALGDQDSERARRFERDVQLFLAEHTFEGVDGVEVDDALRMAVAGGAALLLSGRPGWELGAAGRSVLFYPGAFDEAYYGGDYAAFDGMAHEQGPLLLSARAVRESWANPGDGHNVVLHELAHLFDFQNEGGDGVPSLMAPASEQAWRRLVQAETRRIHRRRSMLRRYAATAPSEFFAVAVENFFERPAEMERRHAELYAALKNFFNLDPAALGTPNVEGQAPETSPPRSTVRKTSGDLTTPSGH